jgi:hypothetical protein
MTEAIKHVFEGVVEIDSEDDGGRALTADIPGDGSQADPCLLVRLQSWDEARQHVAFRRLFGRRVRVTVETVPEEGKEEADLQRLRVEDGSIFIQAGIAIATVSQFTAEQWREASRSPGLAPGYARMLRLIAALRDDMEVRGDG